MSVREVGVHDGVPESIYHADASSLSASGAKVLLKNPARYQWELNNPPQPRDVFDVGTAAHSLILGVGAEPEPIDAPDWRTKAAQERREEIRATGRVPLLLKDYTAVIAMRDAVRSHELANAMLSDGMPEQSMWWVDQDTQVRCRSRIDWLRDDGRVIDLKTCADASDSALIRSVVDFGYDLSCEFYRDGLEALTGERPTFSFIFVEKTPPHYVRVVLNLSDGHAIRGARMARDARSTYAHLEDVGWPAGYEPIDELPLPRWAS